MEFFSKEYLKKFYSMLILGNTGSGKTALAFRLAEEFDPKKVYFVNYPKPEYLEVFGYQNINQFEKILALQDSVIFWDEFQLSFAGLSSFKREQATIRLLSMLRQRGNKVILSTSDTRAVSPRIEAYIGLWLIKQCDYDLTKQRSKVRRIIEKNSFIPEFASLSLANNEFICDSQSHQDLNGKRTFELPEGWSESLSTVYRD